MLTDDAPTDPGESYYVANGGMVFLAATPAGASGLEYQDGSTGTIALADPGATITADLFYVAGGDVLELPGTTVKNVTFGTSSLSVTTDAGSYDFTNVDYFPSPLAGYTSAVDPRTGLVAITFVAPDVFSDTGGRLPLGRTRTTICGATRRTGRKGSRARDLRRGHRCERGGPGR